MRLRLVSKVTATRGPWRLAIPDDEGHDCRPEQESGESHTRTILVAFESERDRTPSPAGCWRHPMRAARRRPLLADHSQGLRCDAQRDAFLLDPSVTWTVRLAQQVVQLRLGGGQM